MTPKEKAIKNLMEVSMLTLFREHLDELLPTGYIHNAIDIALKEQKKEFIEEFESIYNMIESPHWGDGDLRQKLKEDIQNIIDKK